MLVQARLEVILHSLTTDFLHNLASSFDDDERSIGTHFIILGKDQMGQMFMTPTREDPTQVRCVCLSFEEIVTHGAQHDTLKLTVRYATVHDESEGKSIDAAPTLTAIAWEDAIATPKEVTEPEHVEGLARECAMLMMAWLRDGLKPAKQMVH